MNELPLTPTSDAPAGPDGRREDTVTPNATIAARPRMTVIQKVMLALLLLLGLLIALQWWNAQNEITQLRREMAQRLQSGDSSNAETKNLVKTVHEDLKLAQAKLNVLESKQSEAQSQQLALEQLYQELSKNRDDWALAEIEQVLSTASQQLQLAGNVQGALIALQNADARLMRADMPQFIVVRRAIARDIDRLKALPSVDLSGMALRLDSIIGQIDNIPLLTDENPSLPATQPKHVRQPATLPISVEGESAANPVANWTGVVQEKWRSLANELWSEVRQLIRIRTVQNPDALLLSPSEAYYARENLKLRLLNARLALLSRNESAFRNDLIAAQDTIARYFDTRAKQTQNVQALIKQVQAGNLSIEMPTLAESLDAVRNYKAKP